MTLAGLVAVATVAGVVVTGLFAGGVELDLPRGRLAVAPFVDATGIPELAWAERGIPELLAQTLAESRDVELVPRSVLGDLAAQRELDPRRDEDRAELRRLAFAAGADLVLEGSLEKPKRRGQAGQVLTVVVHGRSGEVERAELAGVDPVELVAQLAGAVGRELAGGVVPLPLADAIAPSSFLARLYAMGVQELETTGPKAAAPYFEIVLRHRPELFLPKLRLAECAFRSGDVEKAKELRQALLAEAGERGRRRREAEAMTALAEVSAREKRDEEATALLEQAVQLYSRIGARSEQAAVLERRAELARGAKKLDEAETALRAALDLRRAIGDASGQASTLFALAEIALRRDDVDGADALLSEARAVAAKAGDVWTEMEAAFRLASVARRRGDLEAAVALGREAFDFFAERGDPRRQIAVHRELAESLVARGELAETEDLYQRLLELAKEAGSRHHEALASMRLARVLLAAGYPFQARDHLLRAIELDEQSPDRIELQVLIGWLAYEQGHFRLAADTLRGAERQAGRRWNDDRAALLAAFEAAAAKGERVALPGEEGRPAPAPRPLG